jgi:uncharacterized membrane protein
MISQSDGERIADAIRAAETKTSGEISDHLAQQIDLGTFPEACPTA